MGHTLRSGITHGAGPALMFDDPSLRTTPYNLTLQESDIMPRLRLRGTAGCEETRGITGHLGRRE